MLRFVYLYLRSLRKNLQLAGIMRRLGRRSDPQFVFSRPSDVDGAKQQPLYELLDLVFADTQLAAICRDFQVERPQLEEYYLLIRAYGGAHWERGAFVCAAAIATAPTLRYILSSANATLPEDWTEQDRWMEVTTTLCEYYRNGRIGPVS